MITRSYTVGFDVQHFSFPSNNVTDGLTHENTDELLCYFCFHFMRSVYTMWIFLICKNIQVINCIKEKSSTFDSVDLGNLLDPFGATGVDDYRDGCIYRLQGKPKNNYFE